MKKLLFLILLLAFSFSAYTQSIVESNVKSVPQDTLTKKLSRKDSIKKYFKIIPRVSTIRSAMVPGWGQISNRQYWKLPLVAGGFGTIIFFIVYNDTRYHHYKGWLSLTYPSEDGKRLAVPSVNVPLYNIVDTNGNQAFREYNQSQLNNIVGGYRRNRDGSYLLLAVVWAANIIDANVTAHLKTFDVTDDISLKIQPTFSNPETMSPMLGAKLTLAFK
ncbi:MAG: DUF5683 domain-containing protein [Arcicella sp.]|jgi:hypothetical protein|nr:DUF5683 domain-containing protein [Arcicella sp.]